MLINKPQFDLKKVKPGQVYWLKKNDYYKGINTPCIITEARPLSISLTYWDAKGGKMLNYNISIDEVVDKTFTLEEMVVVK